MRTPSATGLLLKLHRQRVDAVKDRGAIVGGLMAVGDVVVFGLFSDEVTLEGDDRALALFLMFQAGLALFILMAVYRTTTRHLIMSTRVFPLGSWGRFEFCIRALFQHPTIKWLWAVNILIMFFAFGPKPVFLLCVLVMALLLGGIHTLSAALFLWMDRTNRPVTLLGVVFLYGGAVLIAGQMIPALAGPLDHSFVLWYASESMLALARGDLFVGLAYSTTLLTLPAAAVALGRTLT